MNRHERRRTARQDELITEDGAIIAFKHLKKMEFTKVNGEVILMIGGVGQDDKPLVLALRNDQVADLIEYTVTASETAAPSNAASGLH